MVDICCEELEKIDMKLNVMKSQVVRIGRSHSKAVNNIVIGDKTVGYVDELKYLGWYILSANVFRISLHHMRVRFFQCFNSLYAKSNNFSEPVLQHLLNMYCKPYLLYGADVISWTESELSSLRYTFNSAMCKIYKVKFQSLDSIYKYTNEIDIADIIKHRQKNFMLKLRTCSNSVIRHICSVVVH